MALINGTLPDAPVEPAANERVVPAVGGTQLTVMFERHAPDGTWSEQQVRVIAGEYAVCARAFLNMANGREPFEGSDLTGKLYVLAVEIDADTPLVAVATIIVPQLTDREKFKLRAQLSPRVFEGTALLARVTATD